MKVAGVRGDRRATAGAVYVEFLLAFPPLFLTFMAIIQAGLLYGATLVTKHAAYRAVRAAVVVLPDDPARYDGVPVNEYSGLRADLIRQAAAAPLLGVSPSWDQLYGMPGRPAVIPGRAAPVTQSVMRAVGGDPGARVSAAVDAYHAIALDVQLLTAEVEPEGEVTIEVTYLFHCAMPGASSLMCESHDRLGLVKPIRARATLRNQGAHYVYDPPPPPSPPFAGMGS